MEFEGKLKQSKERSGLETVITVLQTPQLLRKDEDIARLLPLLQQIEFFRMRNLKVAELKAVAQCLTYEHHVHGHTVIEYGSYGTTFYIILEGRAAVFVPVSVPKRQVEGSAEDEADKSAEGQTEFVLKEVAVFGTGKSFGELALITNKPR